MRIALDATYSVGKELSGVGVYSREILHGLAAAHPEETWIWACRPHRLLRLLRERLPGNCRRRLLWEGRRLASVELFHGLNQRLPEARYRRAVSTFHDLFVLTAEYSSREFRDRFARQARQAAERSDLVITVSRFTASQVRDLLGVDESRIRVIPHGVRLPPLEASARREKMILHVGALQRRKNILRLLRAFESVPAGWRLVFAGAAGYGAGEILDSIRRSPRRPDIDVLGYVPAPVLAGLYSRARILAFPSLDEGFGIPVLEAMAWGVPVVTSNRSALPEVAGDAALLVDPVNEEEIAHALVSLVRDEKLASALAERGRKRAAEFPWVQAVARTWAVYREVSS